MILIKQIKEWLAPKKEEEVARGFKTLEKAKEMREKKLKRKEEEDERVFDLFGAKKVEPEAVEEEMIEDDGSWNA